MSDGGYANVEEKVLKVRTIPFSPIPLPGYPVDMMISIGPWLKSPTKKTLGHDRFVNMLEGVETSLP